MKEIAVIIVAYNQIDFLKNLYDSLKIQTYKNFRVYFVDNASDNNSIEYVRMLNYNNELDMKFISPGVNLGYAAGNNLGAECAITDGCRYLFILNPDMVLSENCLEELISVIQSDNNIVAVGPLILFGSNPDIIQEYGGKINFFLGEVNKNYSTQNYRKVSLPDITETEFLSGGAMLISADCFKKAGMFDERYFAYFDEIDLIKRIKREKTAKIFVTSKAIVWHHHKWVPENKRAYYIEYYLIERNKYLYFLKYRQFFYLFLSLIVDLTKFPIRLLWFKKVCDYKLGFYYLKGIMDGLRGKKGKPELKIKL